METGLNVSSVFDNLTHIDLIQIYSTCAVLFASAVLLTITFAFKLLTRRLLVEVKRATGEAHMIGTIQTIFEQFFPTDNTDGPDSTVANNLFIIDAATIASIRERLRHVEPGQYSYPDTDDEQED